MMKSRIMLFVSILCLAMSCQTKDTNPMIVLIDDDFKVGHVEAEKALLDSLGIKCTFAAIPREVDGTIRFTDYEKELIDEWQNEGFSFAVHPIHQGWYTNPRNEFLGVDYCEDILCRTISAFQDSPAKDWEDYIVYPGGCNKNPEVVAMMAKYFNFGIAASRTSAAAAITPCEGITQYSRVFLSPGKFTQEEYKEQISEALEQDGVVILGTHSWQYNSTNYGLLVEILDYAGNLGEFVTLQEAMKRIKAGKQVN